MASTDQMVRALVERLNRLEARSGANNLMAGYGNQFIEPGRRDFYAYQATAVGVAAVIGTQATDSIAIEADANFYLTKIAGTGLIADDAPTVAPFGVIPGVSIQINDTGSGRNLFNEAVPLASIAGQAGLPFTLDYPRLVHRNSTLQVTFTQLTDNTAYSDIFLTLIGFKVYPGN
jgi:hypothetical protein